MSEIIYDVIVFALTIGAAFGLSYWAYRACSDRSANVGLYLLFGFPGLLLVIAGLVVSIYGKNVGPVLLATGLGLCLPLVRSVRKLVARFTPMDPTSAIDMTGLCLVLGVIGFLASELLVSQPSPPSNEAAVSVAYLVVQTLAEVGLAYVAVGWLIRRNAAEASCRLGLVRPTGRLIAIAIGLTVLVFIANGTAGYLTEVFQPHVSKQISDVTKTITGDLSNPIGAAILGISAGVGEELLLRGAIQPRYGIILTSILFALLHTQYGFSIVVVGLFATGVLLGLERKYWGTTAAIITHALFDTIVVLAQISR